MSAESAQRDVLSHQRDIARLQDEKGREMQRASEAAKKAVAANAAAARALSPSSAQSRFREAQRHQDDAIKHQKRAADIESKIAAATRRRSDAEKRLADAQNKLSSEQARAAKRHLEEQQRAFRDNAHQMRSVEGRLAAHSRLHEETKNEVRKLRQIPEKITVLFLALEPRDQNKLALGEEARAIQEMIRKSRHRDSVEFESRWAVRPGDVLQHINECQPHVVHFSGHGSRQDELIFQDGDGNTKRVSKEALVQVMAATSGDIQLVFFNSCHSREQAEAVVKHVNAAIGMNTSIGDHAARVFSAQFYSAIGFGLSIKTAFQQARAALMLEGIDEADTPELVLSPEVEEDQLVLVRCAP